jgi:hypothetical protein
MAIDNERLKQKATKLEEMLITYKGEPEVDALERALHILIASAKDKLISIEVEHVPGGYLFSEGSLRKFRDLEEAYASFRIEIYGLADSPVLDKIRKMKEERENKANQ